MKILNEHIKSKSFSKIYLLYGTESYLIKLYKNRLKTAIIGDDDINYSHFDGIQVTTDELRNISDTLPFFSEHRLIIYENSGFFKRASDFADYVPNIPDSTIIVFIESEVDKRNRMYKAVKEHGTVSELNGLDEKSLNLFVVKKITDSGKKITENTLMFFYEYVGTDMQTLSCELEKLICYTNSREVITVNDIKAICTEQLSGKVFQITEAIVLKNSDKAFALYKALLDLKEKPLGILFQIIRHYNCLLQVKELNTENVTNAAIASKVSIMPFLVTKYLTQARKYSVAQLRYAISYGTQLEEDIKKGVLNENLGLEFLIIKMTKI